jgi:hypothetical protein
VKIADDQVGLAAVDHIDGAFCVVSFSDDLKALAELGAQAGSQHSVIVRQYHPQWGYFDHS